MIIADENINHKIIEQVRQIPIDVISVYESFRGMSDEDVIFLSKSMDKIILTEDKDFGEWVFSHHIKGISVLLLRYQFKEQDEIIDSLVTI